MNRETAIYIQRVLAEHENKITMNAHVKMEEFIESDMDIRLSLKEAERALEKTRVELEETAKAMEQIRRFIK